MNKRCWSNNVGEQKLNHLASHPNNVSKICILVSVKHFSPTNLLVMT